MSIYICICSVYIINFSIYLSSYLIFIYIFIFIFKDSSVYVCASCKREFKTIDDLGTHCKEFHKQVLFQSLSLSLSTYLFFSLSSYSSKYLSLLQPGSPFLSYLFSIYFILYKYVTNYQPSYPRWLSPQPKSVRLTNIATLMTLILSRQHRLTCSARKPSRRRSISPADHSYLCLTISPLCIPVWQD